MHIVVLPGDGIGPEISAATSGVLRAASERFQLDLRLEEHAVGHASLKLSGTTVRPELLDTVRAADGLILGPTATFDFKDEAHGEINPSRTFARTSTSTPMSGPPAPMRDGPAGVGISTSSSCARTPKAFTPTATWSRAMANSWSRPTS